MEKIQNLLVPVLTFIAVFSAIRMSKDSKNNLDSKLNPSSIFAESRQQRLTFQKKLDRLKEQGEYCTRINDTTFFINYPVIENEKQVSKQQTMLIKKVN